MVHPEEVVPSEEPPSPVNVLLVDDRADKRLALESILAEAGVRVMTAASGHEALRALLRHEFAVILLDVNMPQLDGFETASLIRGRPSTEKTPIIFMTAVSELEAGMARGYALGAVDYIQLPVQPEVLRAKVAVFVELYRRREQVREQAERRRLREEREHAQRLAEAADRLDFETRRNRFFTLAPDLLAIADLEGRLLQLNSSWQRTLGFSHDEQRARSVADFLHAEDRPAFVDQLRQLAQGAPAARFENRHRHADGSYRWLSWTAAAFREEGLVYLFARDITLSKLAEEARLELVREQEARKAAERDNELKDQFLATLSHELRSPLTPILGWATMLRNEQVAPGEVAHALEVIERNARLQAQLIDDLLDVSRIVSGKFHMQQTPVDLRSVVEKGLDAVRPAADRRQIHLAVDLGPGPVSVLADPERLQQVVWNLAANAVKFSSQAGTVHVRVEADGDTARLSVRDEGVGISPDFLPHAFEHFKQASEGSTRTHGGLGLGLAIVSHIVNAHGGSVAAESGGLGKGATFTVVLPARGGGRAAGARVGRACDARARQHAPGRAQAARRRRRGRRARRAFPRPRAPRRAGDHGVLGGGGARALRLGEPGHGGERHRHGRRGRLRAARAGARAAQPRRQTGAGRGRHRVRDGRRRNPHPRVRLPSSPREAGRPAPRGRDRGVRAAGRRAGRRLGRLRLHRISTRRLSWRPRSELFVATGIVSP
jgi:PAS domain S-box-containing protein